MAIDARIRELGNRHKSLEETIRQELTHPSADPLKGARLLPARRRGAGP